MTKILTANKVMALVRERGYVTVEPLDVVKPSIYQLQDGAIISASINLNHLISNKESDHGFDVNHSITISCFVEEGCRRPDLFDPNLLASAQSHVLERDMEFKTIQEKFTAYRLSNGIIMSIKPVMAEISKTRVYNVVGEPVYLASITPVIKAKPEE